MCKGGGWDERRLEVSERGFKAAGTRVVGVECKVLAGRT
jgi:hypothetical protein